MNPLTLKVTTGVSLSTDRYNTLMKCEWATNVVKDGVPLTIVAGERSIGLVVPPDTTVAQLKAVASVLLDPEDYGTGHFRYLRFVDGCIYENFITASKLWEEHLRTNYEFTSIRLFWG